MEEYKKTPSNIGAYVVERFYKRGGVSLLYLAHSVGSMEHVICKVLKKQCFQRAEIVQLFLNEAKILSSVDHPNIVKIFSYGEWEEGVFIAMELIYGRDLHSHIGKTPFSLKKSLEIILEISHALCYLHSRGIVHLDLKPENILISEEGIVKLIDFGASKFIDDQMEPGKEGYRLVGTPIYMSPEQISKGKQVSCQSDIYSLGIIAYELILGQLSGGKLSLALLPKGLQIIVSQALQPDVKNRYQTIVELISDLSSYLNSSAIRTEAKPVDHLSTIAEDLLQVQKKMIFTHKSLQIKGFDLGLTFNPSYQMIGAYYDCFQLAFEKNIVVFIQALEMGSESIVLTATIKGMIKTLIQLTTNPLSILSFLNEMIAQEYPDKFFSALFLYLEQKSNTYQYVNCGASHGWHIDRKKGEGEKFKILYPPLGTSRYVEFQWKISYWKRDDLLLIHTHSNQMDMNPLFFFKDAKWKDRLQYQQNISSQNYVENLMRCIRLNAESKLDHSLFLLAIQSLSDFLEGS